MRRAVAILLCTLLLCACGWFGDDAPPLEEGFHYLFDGENLEGWHKIGGGATFAVDDGAIVGTHGPGENTFLRTDQVFGDFILKLQVRFDQPGNSGILFRAQQRGGNGRAYGYQYELDTSERSWSGGIYDEARRQWLYPLEDNPEARQAFKLDAWNEVVIEARGADIQTWINGIPAAHLADALDLEGYIGLQVHAGNTGIIRWRNIRIQPLGKHEWQREGIAEVRAWRSEAGLAVEDDTLLVDAAGPVELSSRRELSDHALGFTLPPCAEGTVYIRQQDDTGAGGLALSINPQQLVLRAANQSEPLGSTTFDQPQDHYRIDIAAIADRATVTVNERLLGRADGLGLPERGKLVIEIDGCEAPLRIADLRWLDLRQQSDEKLLYQTLDTPPAPVLSPEEALQTFRLAPGFRIELVAAEPLVEDPVAMAWDADGRLYVVEMRGFMPDAYGEGQEKPVGRVVVLEDQNGDGTMDTSEVYLDRLVNPRAIAVVNEGVLVGEPPHLWLCRDTTGDLRCDDKTRVADYGGENEGNIEHMENGLLPGLDNWIYNAMSSRRFKLVDGELVTDKTLPRGQWGIAQDDQGRLYYNNNSTFILGDLFPAEKLLVDGRLAPTEGVGSTLHSKDASGKDEVFSIRVNPGVNRAYLDGILRPDGRLASPTAVSGLTVYRGDQFPAEFDQDIFIPEPGANVVAHFRTRDDGMDVYAEHITYADEQWQQREFLASTDERFRPVDASIGPDGALYIIDMYRGIIQEAAFLTDELREQIFERDLDTPLGHGRIWRIVHDNAEPDYQSPALASAGIDDLITALSHGNGWRRDTAQRLLAGKPGAVPALREAVVSSPETIAAVHALWALQAQEALNRATVMAALQRGEPVLALQALRAGGDQLAATDLLALSENAESAAVTHELAFQFAPHSDTAAVQQALLSQLGRGQPLLDTAILHTLRGNEQRFLARLLADPAWEAADDQRAEALSRLSANSYRQLRPELQSTEPAPERLKELLSLTEAQSGDQAWRQLAMLEGFREVSRTAGFKPAQLETIPSLFSDSSLAEDDPLWQARLDGRRAFTWPGDELAAGLEPLSPKQLAQVEKGKTLYVGCASCHGDEGQGKTGLAPPLAGASWVVGPPEWLARIVLQGLSGPIEVAGETWNGVMPGHQSQAGFDDEGIAGLLTYMRRSWGNTAEPVGADFVAEVRQATSDRATPWTAGELEAVPFTTGFEKFEGTYKVSFVSFTIFQKDGELRIEVPMYGEGALEHQVDNIFIADPGGQNARVEFEVEADKSVPAMFLYRDGQKIRVERVE